MGAHDPTHNEISNFKCKIGEGVMYAGLRHISTLLFAPNIHLVMIHVTGVYSQQQKHVINKWVGMVATKYGRHTHYLYTQLHTIDIANDCLLNF